MGCWRSRLDGILYSKGKNIILFDTADLYEYNYVLEYAFNILFSKLLDALISLPFIIKLFFNFLYCGYLLLNKDSILENLSVFLQIIEQ